MPKEKRSHQFVSSHELDEMVHGVHQGVVAIVKQDYAFVSLDELLHKTKNMSILF